MIIDELEEEIREDLEEETKEEPKCIKQLVLIAAETVKFPLDQVVINRFTAIIVLRKMGILDQEGLKDPVSENLEKEILEDPALKKGGCMGQLALIAATDVKFPSGPRVINRFTAMIVLVKAEAMISDQKNLPSALSSTLRLRPEGRAQALNGANPMSSLSN